MKGGWCFYNLYTLSHILASCAVPSCSASSPEDLCQHAQIFTTHIYMHTQRQVVIIEVTLAIRPQQTPKLDKCRDKRVSHGGHSQYTSGDTYHTPTDTYHTPTNSPELDMLLQQSTYFPIADIFLDNMDSLIQQKPSHS